MAMVPDDKLAAFIATLDNSQLFFLGKWLGDTFEDDTNHHKIWLAISLEGVKRLYKPPFMSYMDSLVAYARND